MQPPEREGSATTILRELKNSSMRRLLSIYLGVTLVIVHHLAPVGAGLFAENGPVIELSSTTFREVIEASPGPVKPDYIVLFYSSLCSHCRKFAPYFHDTAASLRTAGGVRFCAIDGANPTNWDILIERNIRFFPRVYTITSKFNDPLRSWEPEWEELAVNPLESFRDRLIGRMPHLRSFVSNRADPLKVHILPKNIDSSAPLAMNLDASSALSTLLNTEVFRGNETVLNTEKVEGLRALLKLCYNILALPDVKTDCQNLHLALGGQLTPPTREFWTSTLKQTRSLKPSAIEPSFRTCQTYSCALWRLLHLFSLGPVGSRAHEAEIRPLDAMNGIRNVVDLFFSCSECRHHFLEGFDGCLYERCAVAGPKMNWSHTGLWLWRFHNSVTNRVKNSNTSWPDSGLCKECFNPDQGYYDDRVLAFMQGYFWMNDLQFNDTVVSSGLIGTKAFQPLYSTWAIPLSFILVMYIF